MRFLIVASALVFALAITAPASASCGTAALIDGTDPTGVKSWVFSAAFQNAPTFAYYAGTPSAYYIPPLSMNANATFWRVGSGDPTIGLGDDSGVYDMIAAGGLSYGAYPAYSFYFAADLFGSWQPPGIDGCVGANSCMCLLLTDHDGSEGYFAVVGGMSDPNFNTNMNLGGSDGNGNSLPIILQPIPAPTIVASAAPSATQRDVTLEVGPPTQGVYSLDGCMCGPTGYKVLQATVPSGGMPPSNRDLVAWNEPLDSMGAPQDVTPIGGQVTIRSDCGGNTDVYLTTQLFFESGFSSSIVSSNATRVACDPNLADPDTKPVRPTHPRGDRPSNPRRR